jgi:hypothetical protein
MNQDDFYQGIIDEYEAFISPKYPDHVRVWPVISGYDVTIAYYQNYEILFFKHKIGRNITSRIIVGEIPPRMIGVENISTETVCIARKNLEKYFSASLNDCLLILKEDRSNLQSEFELALQKHAYSLGLITMKIFLSHKGADKPKVREFKKTLQSIGFDPWIDEDAMPAGAKLERSLLQGFKDSCAVVFFITENYADEGYLATEVEYAVAEKRKKGDKFSIITLVYKQDAQNKVQVPELLQPYIWKEPANDLEGLREILNALPVKVGEVYWRL